MTELYELRTYVAQPGKLGVLAGQWSSHHHAIYSDYYTVLGGFTSRPAPDGQENGVALLLEHENRAEVDVNMNRIIASNRMNEVPGPPGRTLVDHWERTFLYPLDGSPLQ